MNLRTRIRQVVIIARLEARRAFFSKRAFWVYFLALFPAAAFVLHIIETRVEVERYRRYPLAEATLVDSITTGETPEQVLARVGKPFYDRSFSRRVQSEVKEKGKNRDRDRERVQFRVMGYFDGARRTDLVFRNGALERKNVRLMLNFEEDRSIFAGIFQMFYLRLAIFFGCLGIFMNLFRGEMLDKTLHFWLLAPVRREVLLGGKYAAGLLASVLIFTAGAGLAFLVMLLPHNSIEVQNFWNQHGVAHLLRYMLAAALACAGYGSVFVAAGLFLRNPIIPAAVLLLWENAANFLPAALQRLSVLHYAQAICPVRLPVDEGTPALVRLFIQPADPPSAPSAVLGLLALTVLVLLLAARASRRLQINYSTE